ncbi:START domain-containing protein [Dyadobacter pollutisoli]|uniref:START domain-containing protein n=1 Tax=Dyadobacter pollutisoli TaxID=2910158 RepID=A0A9E8N6K4_9BACT|nr:START domain-containing protein [Dyadobacter pollutisoli]WAC10283.1 START domain-containing protein [Dyadobacter pollutisoli]
MIFCLLIFSVNAQTDWKLIAEKEQIRIFSQSVPESKIKAIKVNCTVDASVTQLVALLMDVEGGVNWVYKTKSCVLLRKVSPTELYYYSEISLPWPLENRDFVAHLRLTQDRATKVVTIDGPVVNGMVSIKKGIVRVNQSKGRWVLTPAGRDRTKIEYTLHTDPGGNVPAWAVNLFAAEGPMETFKSMKQQLKLAKYRNAVLGFVVN